MKSTAILCLGSLIRVCSSSAKTVFPRAVDRIANDRFAPGREAADKGSVPQLCAEHDRHRPESVL